MHLPRRTTYCYTFRIVTTNYDRLIEEMQNLPKRFRPRSRLFRIRTNEKLRSADHESMLTEHDSDLPLKPLISM